MISDIKFQRAFSIENGCGIIRVDVFSDGAQFHCSSFDDEDGVASALEVLAKKLRSVAEERRLENFAAGACCETNT